MSMAGTGRAIVSHLAHFSIVWMLLIGPIAAWSHSRTICENAAVDQQVLETVLHDLLTEPSTDSPVAIRGSAPKRLLFSPRAAVRPQSVEDVLYRHEKKPWDKLTRVEVVRTHEAAEHLLQRIGANDSFSAFQPKDKRVLIRDEAASGKRPAGLRIWYDRPIQAWPPGYSQDKSLCIVRLVIPWSIHHADATYILVKRKARWAVLLRQFVYYV
jgi:hypothetical protein